MMTRYLPFLLILAFLLQGCLSKVPTTTATKVDEAFVFGRVKLVNGPDVDLKRLRLRFNDRMKEKYSLPVDENGYFFGSLPLAYNYIAVLDYFERPGYFVNVVGYYAAVKMNSADPQKAYYLGDLRISWSPNANYERSNPGNGGAMSGIASVMNDSQKAAEKPPIEVDVNQETIENFKKQFPGNTKEIVTDTLVITP